MLITAITNADMAGCFAIIAAHIPIIKSSYTPINTDTTHRRAAIAMPAPMIAGAKIIRYTGNIARSGAGYITCPNPSTGKTDFIAAALTCANITAI